MRIVEKKLEMRRTGKGKDKRLMWHSNKYFIKLNPSPLLIQEEDNLTQKERCKMEMLQPNWVKEYAYAGSYQTAIMRACEVADSVNLEKLSTIYPKIVEAYRNFAWGEKE